MPLPRGGVLLGSPPMSTPTDGLALPTMERPDPVTPRSRRRGWSLRAHLIAVVLVTIALVVLSGVLSIVLPDGSVLCSSNQSLLQPGTHPYAGAQWLTPVVDRNAATVVGPIIDPLTKRSSLFVAAPIPAPNAPPDARPPGVLAVSLDMTPLASTLHERFAADRYPANSLEYLITTAKRDKVVSRSIQPEQSVGKPLDASAYARADSPKGAVLKDLNGTDRLYV